MKYLIYNNTGYNGKNIYEINKCGVMYVKGLYAWTDKKTYAKEFLEFRNSYGKHENVYSLEKIDLKPGGKDYERLENLYSDNKLVKRDINTSDEENPFEIVVTLNELTNVLEFRDENLNEFVVDKLFYADYRIFKPKYIDCLDDICYTSQFLAEIVPLTKDADDEREHAYYNASFHKTLGGRELLISIYENTLLAFYLLYKEVL